MAGENGSQVNIFTFTVDNDFDDWNQLFYVEAEDIVTALMKAQDNISELEKRVKAAFPHWKGKISITTLEASGMRMLDDAQMDAYVERLRQNYVIEEN